MVDAVAFLAAEVEGWAPFEALADLADEDLERPIAEAHDWSGRDLMAHLVFWMEIGTTEIRELAVSDTSPTAAWVEETWANDQGWNERVLAEWMALPLVEVRARFAAAPAALRAALDAAPSSRWWEDPANQANLLEETTDHYADHVADLAAIIAAAGR